jgi:putative peptide zinc metalloprotease protein
LIDTISGKIARLSNADLKTLQQASSGKFGDDDRELVAQAESAGLLRRRSAASSDLQSRSWWLLPMRLLAFRVPLVNVDGVAKRLATYATCVLSPLALLIWSCGIFIAAVSLMAGWARAEKSLAAMFEAAGSLTTIGYTMTGLFVLTKLTHELAHAVACRRFGIAVGDLGLFFFCGVPCPYVDVSRVWQLDSRVSRAAVMMAGIYVELIIAMLATVVWWATQGGSLHLLAMNLMIVCGVSTLVFNANPLMRLDGYFVLSDLLGTPNLRRQASLAWRRLVTHRIAGATSMTARWSFAGIGLASYHVASTLYRTMIAAVIVSFIWTLLHEWHFWWLGFAIAMAFVAALIHRYWIGWLKMMQGKGIWGETPRWRRGLAGLAVVLTLSLVLLLPLSQAVTCEGVVDVADASELFVAESGWVDEVAREFGEAVSAGQPIAKLRDDELQTQLVSWKARGRMASLESEYLKRKSLQSPHADVSWKVDQANRELVEAQYQSLVHRADRLVLTAPVSGELLPPLSLPTPSNVGTSPFTDRLIPLSERQGTFVAERTLWCRIGSRDRMCVKLVVSAEERQHLKLGDRVLVVIDDGSVRRVYTQIEAIDEIASSETQSYVVRCDLPQEHLQDDAPVCMGARVTARIIFGEETMFDWAWRKMNEVMRG